MNGIKAVFLDLDNTILDFSKAERYAIKKTFKIYNIKRNKKNVNLYKNVNLSYWQKLERKEITQDELKKTRFKEFFEKVGVQDDNPLKANDIFLDALTDKVFFVKDAFKMLKYLKKKGYDLYIITNGIKYVQDGRLNKKKVIFKYINEVFISESIGFTKPDPNFIDYCLNKINYKKEEIVIVGDSLTSDIKLGMNSEVQTIWFNIEKKENKDYKPTYTIYKLKEIKNIL